MRRTDEERDALAAVDEIARGVIALAPPVAFTVATTQREHEAAFRLRNLVAVREGWIGADAFPDGLEHDDYDDAAVQLVGLDGADVVATARLVLPSPERALPMETFFGITVEPAGRVVELGRQSIEPGHRRRDHTLFYALLGCAWLEARRRGFDVLGGLASAAMLERYSEMGFDMTVLGPAKHYWGEDRHPIRFDVVDNEANLQAQYGALTADLATAERGPS